MKKVMLLCCLLVSGFLQALPSLLPWPRQVEWNKQTAVLKEVTLLSSPQTEETAVRFFRETGIACADNRFPVEIKIVNEIAGVAGNPEEAYRLEVTSKKITVNAITPRGVYWALQTLRQLCTRKGNKTYVTGCHITDWPAFRIRGFMHDTGRSYISLDELKKEISTLSRYKINVFHWHLTEDLGWRLESKVFPMLNDSSNFGRMSGQYYTLAEAKELTEFCRQHNVLLIPEIDMPGHSAAFRKTFRHDMQSKEGTAILKLLIDEVCETFSGLPYLHIGTDEVEFTNPAFVPEMVTYIRNKGMKVISWNPGWQYNDGEIDLIQMWSSRGKPHKGIPTVDSRLHYINHFDSFADIFTLYNSTVAEQTSGSPDYAGAIIGVWNDRLVQPERNILLENPFYPAMLALAERSWLGGGNGYFASSLLPADGTPAFTGFADFENRMLWHKAHALKGYPFAYVRQTNVKWRITDAFPNGGDLLKAFPPEHQCDTVYLYNGKEYKTREVTGAGIYLRHVWGNTVPSFYADPQPNHTAYAYTWVYSPHKQEVGLWACTQNYGRSEKDLPPPAGKWDYRESRFWLNGAEIQPPAWTATHTEKSNEIPLGNENFESRPPLPVTLNKGWNQVLIKLPVGAFTTPEVRLVKWMFTCVFVTPDGENAVEGLIYSPLKKRN